MSDGSIMVEWRSAFYELTLEVHGPNNVSVLFENLQSGAIQEFWTSSDFSKIMEALDQSNGIQAVA